MSIDPAEFDRIKTVAILMRNYFKTSGLQLDDANRILDLLSRFRSETLNDFIIALQNFRVFLIANNITRSEVVKAVELIRLLK